MKCECGEDVSGDVCMLCGNGVSAYEEAPSYDTDDDYTTEDTPMDIQYDTPPDTPPGDETRSGRLGQYLLDIAESIQISDEAGHTIYDIPYNDVKCTRLLGALRIQHTGRTVSLRGPDTKAWQRAIQYVQSPPVWYLRGAEDCEVWYGGALLGVTPCVVTPPFSWKAFRSGSYNLTLQRPGGSPIQKDIQAASGTHNIRYKEGTPAIRQGGRPEGSVLVLNTDRSLVMAEHPCITDGQGRIVLRMPGAVASVGLLKRGADITWNEPGLGDLSVHVKCDAALKYDRLRELLPKPEPIEQPKAEQKSWWKRDKKANKYNRGTYEGTNLCITKIDLDTRFGRFDGYSFEGVCANLLSAMGYHIEKGYDVRAGRMKGTTRSDKGIDILAVKDDERLVVQCKLMLDACGGPDVNKTIGSATTESGTAVLMISTGGFTEQATSIAAQSSMPVRLWGLETIIGHMRRHLL